MREFTGNPAPLQAADYERAAKALGCTVAAVRAVCDVEGGDGFLADGRPRILFERHIFSRQTSRRFDAAHPDLSNRTPGGYLGGAAEYARLTAAIALDRTAALEAASWGAFQIMGFNHQPAGFPNVEAFVKGMVSGAAAQLDAFVRFILSVGLADELARRDWPAFARRYNGPDHAKNHYAPRLAAACARHDQDTRPTLRLGDKGEAVKHLQSALGLPADGHFGPATKAAVLKAQTAAALRPDGVVGPQTWRLLL